MELAGLPTSSQATNVHFHPLFDSIAMTDLGAASGCAQPGEASSDPTLFGRSIAALTVDAGVGGDTGVARPDACPTADPQVSFVDGQCILGDGLNNGADLVTMTESLSLCAGDYLLTDQLMVGTDSAPGTDAGVQETVLSLAPGVLLRDAEGTFLSIPRGAKLMAVGTAASPVVLLLTGNEDDSIDWTQAGTASYFPTCLAVDGDESTAAALAGETVLENVALNCDLSAAADDAGPQGLFGGAAVREISVVASP